MNDTQSDRWLSFALRAGLVALFFWMVKGLLVPVLLGGLVALLVSPLQRRLSPRLGRFRGFAPAIFTVGVIILVCIPLTVIVIEASASISRFFARDWSSTIERVQGMLNDGRITGLINRAGLSGDDVRTYVSNLFQRVGSSMASFAGGMFAAVPQSIVDAFLFTVGLYYLLRDGGQLLRWLLTQSPFRHEETDVLFASIQDTVHGAVLGLLATAAVQGTLTTVALFVFKVPGAFLFGILATLLSLVPMIGTTPVTLGAAIYLFIVGRVGGGIGMCVAAGLIGLSDNVIRPWVQSSHGGMHPLIALLSIFGGLELFGAAGIFIGPVVAAIVLWAVNTRSALASSSLPIGLHSSRPPPSLGPTSRPPPTSGAPPTSRPPPASRPPSI
ncbi:AI-2E family transporter [Sorangium sp. So ce1024]|uniref:AI-2E family transporter n=1 Tax=unclassified Sorangium TaxID=2621164 RepID=UPI003F0B44E8